MPDALIYPPESVENELTRLRDQARQEFVQLQIIGRALTPEEQRRSDALDRVVSLLEQAIAELAQPEVEPPAQWIELREGAYSLGNDILSGDLRIDRSGRGLISIDLFQGSGDSRVFRVSLRSHPGEAVGAGDRFIGVIAEDEPGEQTLGMLEFTPINEQQSSISIELDEPLGGLPSQTTILLSATWRSETFRTIGIEIDREAGLAELPSFDFNGVPVTIESAFRDAGVELIQVGARNEIPVPQQKWDDSNLHGLMTQFADIDLSRRAWNLHLLQLSDTRAGGLLGVMFDSGRQDANGLPRQGAAIFATPMQGHGAGFERKIIQTTMHELGHALNLAHRFEREVGRADSTSFMNYDWRFQGGGRSLEFWRRFEFRFDEDELRFLRHAPLHKIIPGSAEFHTVSYWSEGGGGYTPYLPESEIDDLSIRLIPPASGAVFDFAQPVLLTIELTNNTGSALDIPDYFLDPKAGFMQLVIERHTGIGGGGGEERFRPIFNRCYDLSLSTAEVVPDGGSISDNVNLTFGSAGFTFAEPGNYRVQAVLSIFDDVNRRELVIRSEPLAIRVSYPRSAEEEADALKIFTKDVGFYLMLGGSDELPEAKQNLEEVRERRMYRKPKVADALVATILRCEAINASREFVQVKGRGDYGMRAADPEKALEKIEKLDPILTQTFDPSTVKQMAGFVKFLEKSVGKSKGKGKGKGKADKVK